MYVCTSIRPLCPDEIILRRTALRDAVICIGWLKILSMFCYVGLYLLVVANSKGKISTTLQLMLLATIPFQIINGLLLFLGAVEIKILALHIAMWMCVLIAIYNTVLGLMGGIYFIRTGFLTMHFLLSITFALLSLSIFSVLCHDVIVIYAFKSLVECPPSPPPPLELIPPIMPSHSSRSEECGAT